MIATLTIDESGKIDLPESLRRVFGASPGVRIRAEVTEDQIKIVKDDLPEVTAGVYENGVLVIPAFGIKTDAAAAVRAERDELAARAVRR